VNEPPRRDGCAFLAELPSGYDEQTRMVLSPDNVILLVHPALPPMLYDEKAMQWVEVKL
jgi:hypothetical protein